MSNPWTWTTTWQQGDNGPYTITVELGQVPHGTGMRVDAQRITVEMTTTPMTATAWRKILPIPLIHQAIQDNLKPQWEAGWGPGSEDAIGMLGRGLMYHHEGPVAMTDAERAQLVRSRRATGAAIAREQRIHEQQSGGNRPQQTLTIDQRVQLVAALHTEAIEHNEPAPREYVLTRLAADHGISVSTKTVSRDIARAVAEGWTTPSITRTKKEAGK